MDSLAQALPMRERFLDFLCPIPKRGQFLFLRFALCDHVIDFSSFRVEILAKKHPTRKHRCYAG
jgi:hypothetical protein